MDLYLKTCYEVSRLMTNRYSTSFSLGIKVFPKEAQDAIYGIYGFVRVADEIVDTFQSCDKKILLEQFKKDVNGAIRAGVSTNPVLEVFQDVVKKYKIDGEYIDAFLASMEMDLTLKFHDKNSYDRYVYGSAEVIGLMCLKVFCAGNEPLFKELVVPARKLGSAFQKVNFLRDIKNDLEARGRIYLPGIRNKEDINEAAKKRMEAEVEEEFKVALDGIRKIPRSYVLAVYSVYLYYNALFRKIKNLDAAFLLSKRVRICDFHKLLLLIRAYFIVTFFGSRF
ncbi:MAG TPA: phytoene/squalene synthase family protein [Candidatus Omnitrophota bacterium]|nr:phytoene/squalene synthase family protein [Candidatus Omnitrophota bacterium]HPD84866.1 phytoene/squalene synthase family protein [Candidatus Omnitrophota bacterium]HRZ03724.1 phytoene/squalene synthase family protein [Candidatus Omnitrophota bacterium]